MFYNHFIPTLYHFLGLTYWPSAQCQLLFFACFLHRRKSISNGVQTPRNFLWIFYGPEEYQLAKVAPRGCPEGGDNQPGHAWAPRRTLVGCAPLGAPQVLLWPILGVLVHKKTPKSFTVFGLCLILISCDVKNKQKTATGTRQWVNRLVPKNDIKLLENDCKIS